MDRGRRSVHPPCGMPEYPTAAAASIPGHCRRKAARSSPPGSCWRSKRRSSFQSPPPGFGLSAPEPCTVRTCPERVELPMPALLDLNVSAESRARLCKRRRHRLENNQGNRAQCLLKCGIRVNLNSQLPATLQPVDDSGSNTQRQATIFISSQLNFKSRSGPSSIVIRSTLTDSSFDLALSLMQRVHF